MCRCGKDKKRHNLSAESRDLNSVIHFVPMYYRECMVLDF